MELKGTHEQVGSIGYTVVDETPVGKIVNLGYFTEDCYIMDEIIEKLRDKDENAAYEFAKKLGIESAESDKYVEKIPVFSEMLTDKNSYIRTRAFMLICNQARWADNGQIEMAFNQMKALLYDAKPTVVRQCLGALHEVILYRPEMIELIIEAVNNIDLSVYKDSMSPLIKKDIEELMAVVK